VDEVLAASEPDAALLPPIVEPETIVGEVSATASAQTGIPAGTPLVVGGADHVLSAYAAGLSAPGDMRVKLGGAGDILVVADHVVVDRRLNLDVHPRPGLWLPNGWMATSGSLIRWFQILIGGVALTDLDEHEQARAPAEVLCLCTSSARSRDPRPRPAGRGCDVTVADLDRAAAARVAGEIGGDHGARKTPLRSTASVRSS
jgi:xylulokinase